MNAGIVQPTDTGRIFKKFIGKVEVRPNGQSRLSLDASKGICIEFSPALPNNDAVQVQLTEAGDAKKRHFVLSMVSRYSKPFSAEVWQM